MLFGLTATCICLAGVCPLGWTYHLSSCFFYNVGASTYRQAALFCQTERGVVLSTLMLDDLKPMVDEFISYEDLDGTDKSSVIWISNGEDNGRSCPVYPVRVNDKNDTDIAETNVQRTSPVHLQTNVRGSMQELLLQQRFLHRHDVPLLQVSRYVFGQ